MIYKMPTYIIGKYIINKCLELEDSFMFYIAYG